MLSGEFYRKLRSLNNNLRIWCGDNDSKPAGLYIVKNGEYTELCGVDKQEVPKHTVWKGTSIHKGGWLRVLKLLVAKKLIEKQKAESVFRFSFERRKAPKPRVKTPSQVKDLIEQKHKF